jgi:hypothetical protein
MRAAFSLPLMGEIAERESCEELSGSIEEGGQEVHLEAGSAALKRWKRPPRPRDRFHQEGQERGTWRRQQKSCNVYLRLD